MRKSRHSRSRRFQDLQVVLGLLGVFTLLWCYRAVFLAPPASPSASAPASAAFNLSFLGPTNLSAFLQSTDPFHQAAGSNAVDLSSALDLRTPLARAAIIPADDLSPLAAPPPEKPGTAEPVLSIASAPTPFQLPPIVRSSPSLLPDAVWELDAPGFLSIRADDLRVLSTQAVAQGSCSAVLVLSTLAPVSDDASATNAATIVDSVVFRSGFDTLPESARADIGRVLRKTRVGQTSVPTALVSWRWRR